MSKTLIYGTSYIATPERMELTKLWAKLCAKLNPDCDLLLVDSASPFDPMKFMPENLLWIRRFHDNLGHLNAGGGDGWGRAFCYGLQFGIDEGYDRIAYIDADILFAKPVGPIFDKMERNGVKVSCPLDMNFQFLENGIVFMNPEYMRDIRFIERYDWPNSPQMPLPERRFELLLEDALFTLPLRGCRNDFDLVTMANCREAFPWSWDYLTHAKDFNLYYRFLELNGITL